MITFHVRTERGRWSLDADRTVPSASVIKAMLMVAYLDRPASGAARSTRRRPARCWSR